MPVDDKRYRSPKRLGPADTGQIAARMTGKRVGVDTATGMLERGDGLRERPPVRLSGLTFSALYVIYIVA